MLPTCPKCNSLAVGDRCGTCGTVLTPQPASQHLTVAAPGLDLDVGPSASAHAHVEPTGGGGTRRQASAYLSLEPSETAVLHAASRIFAAFVTTGVVTDANQHELSDRSVKLATRMALVIEKYIQSDDEDW
jgi:hypothetical protein